MSLYKKGKNRTPFETLLRYFQTVFLPLKRSNVKLEGEITVIRADKAKRLSGNSTIL